MCLFGACKPNGAGSAAYLQGYIVLDSLASDALIVEQDFLAAASWFE
jgi:hypothetical protein